MSGSLSTDATAPLSDRRRTELLSISGMYAAVQRVAEAMVGISRSLANSQPRAHAMPFFLLDSSGDYDLAALDTISTPGIFRKYELALEVGCGLGGRTRWLAARTGCKIVGIDPTPALVAAAETLNRAGCFQEQVRFASADPTKLGLASDTFTHVWMLDMQPNVALATAVSEGLRVLRKGGHFVLQSTDLGSDAARGLESSLRSWGLVDLETRIVRLPNLPASSERARDKIRLMLKRSWPDARVCELLWVPRVDDRIVQVFGRRPA